MTNQSLFDAVRQCYKRGGISRLVKKSIEIPAERGIFFAYNRLGWLDVDDLYDEKYYKNTISEHYIEDSENFSEVVINKYDPQSVIDFGCGAGRFLIPFWKQDIEIKGIDASTNAFNTAPLPDAVLEKQDLRSPYYSDKTYDISLCIEVLEHIPSEYSDTIVDSITSSASIAIITAAPPGQGGRHHVNEQSRSYWIEKFSNYGFSYSDYDTRKVKNQISIEHLDWLRENLMIFYCEKQ